MRRWVASLIFIVAIAAPVAAFAKGGPSEQPSWLEASESRAVATYFGSPHLTMVGVYPEAQAIQVIFQFQDVVACRRCAHPAESRPPTGRVVRVTFARATHRVSGSMKLCDPHGITEPVQSCLNG